MLITDPKIKEALVIGQRIKRMGWTNKQICLAVWDEPVTLMVEIDGEFIRPLEPWEDIFADDWEIVEEKKTLKFPDDYKKIRSMMSLYRLTHDDEGYVNFEKYGKDILIRHRDWDEKAAIRLTNYSLRFINPENTELLSVAYIPTREILDDNWELWIPK